MGWLHVFYIWSNFFRGACGGSECGLETFSWELKKLPKSINHLPHIALKAGIISFWPIPAYFHIFHPYHTPFRRVSVDHPCRALFYWDTKEAVATAASGLAQGIWGEGPKCPARRSLVNGEWFVNDHVLRHFVGNGRDFPIFARIFRQDVRKWKAA